jgi:hypothetical protein
MLERFRLMVAPLRFGAGGKGKLVTSMSYGLPSVVTPMAAESMSLMDGRAIMVAETNEQFIQQLLSCTMTRPAGRRRQMQRCALPKPSILLRSALPISATC